MTQNSDTNNTVVGIDVGLTGAICQKNPASFSIIKMPIVKITDSTYKRWYDVAELLRIFNKIPKNATIIIEYQRPMSQQGVVSVFRLGRGFGLLEGMLRSIFSDVSVVDPQVWQKFLFKKYLSAEENTCFKRDPLSIKDNLESPYKEIFTEKASLKSYKLTKLKTLYCLYKSGYIAQFSEKDLKDHDKIDSFMLALYGEFSKNN